MQKHFYVRTIRPDCTIILNRRRWRCKRSGDPSHLIGMKIVFHDYLPSSPDLVGLWGTPRFYRAEYESPEQDAAWTEQCELLGVGPFEDEITDHQYYESRDLEWWEPTDEPRAGGAGR